METEKTNPQELDFSFSPEDIVDGEQDGLELDVEQGKPTPQTIKVKYNKEERELTQEEAIEYAQKGLNYDHVLSERDSLRQLKKELEAIAQDEGLPFDDYLGNLKGAKLNKAIDSRAKELEAEGMKPEHAKKMAELELKAPVVKDDTKALALEFETLYQEFPETKDFKELSDFPPEVIELIKLGKSPLVAWSKHTTEQVRKQAEIDKQNALNAVKNTGGLGSQETEGKKDKFLEGLGL